MPVILTEKKTHLRLVIKFSLKVRKELFVNPDDGDKKYLTKYLSGFQSAKSRTECVTDLADLVENYFTAYKPGQRIDYKEVFDFIRNSTSPGYEVSKKRMDAQSADEKTQTATASGQFIRTRSVEIIAPTLNIEFIDVTP